MSFFTNLFGFGNPEPQEPEPSIIQITDQDLSNVDESVFQQAAEQNQRPQPTRTVVSEHDPIGHVGITLCANGDINLHFDWIAETEPIANSMAEMLHHLNEGHIKDSMKDVLKAYAQQSENAAGFVRRLFKTWDKLSGIGRPLIKPSEGLGHSMAHAKESE